MIQGDRVREALSSKEAHDIYIVLIIILTACGSFGLGRLSKQESKKEPVTIEYADGKHVEQTASSISSLESETPESNQKVFASKKGKKYYFLSCSGISAIKKENLISFSSPEEATRSGYSKSSTCK